MVDLARTFLVRVGWLTLAIVIIWLAWQGNIGKGLACIISPASLEIDYSGTDQQKADTSGSNSDGNPTTAVPL